MLEAGGDVVGFDVDVGELVGLVAHGDGVTGDAFGGTGVDGAHRAVVDGPAEDLAVEGVGCCFVFAADFEVDDGVGHGALLSICEEYRWNGLAGQVRNGIACQRALV